MAAPAALKKLASRYNILLYKNDRLFYRKYNTKVEIHLAPSSMREEFASIDSIDLVQTLRDLAHKEGDQVRRERWTLNYYTNDISTLESVIDSVEQSRGKIFQIQWFPADIEKNIILRKRPVEYKFGVRLSRGAPSERLREFVEQNSTSIQLDKSADYELFPDKRQIRFNRRSQGTWGYTNFRFNDETLKNYFIFSFAEYVVQELTYVYHKEVQNEQ